MAQVRRQYLLHIHTRISEQKLHYAALLRSGPSFLGGCIDVLQLGGCNDFLTIGVAANLVPGDLTTAAAEQPTTSNAQTACILPHFNTGRLHLPPAAGEVSNQ
jgi:hypothetical protein